MPAALTVRNVLLQLVEEAGRSPIPSFSPIHDGGHRSGQWIRPEGVSLDSPAICFECLHEPSGRPREGRFGRPDPLAEVGKARLLFEVDLVVPLKRTTNRVQQRAEHLRVNILELGSDPPFRSALFFGDRWQSQLESSVGKIVALYDSSDPVQDDGTPGLDDGLVAVGVQLPRCEPAS